MPTAYRGIVRISCAEQREDCKVGENVRTTCISCERGNVEILNLKNEVVYPSKRAQKADSPPEDIDGGTADPKEE